MTSELVRLKQGGFTNRPNRKAIETWIEGYLKLVSSGNRLREERKFIEKAIIMINKVFGHPCCDNPTSIIDFGTPYDNQLTNTIRNLIINGNIIRRSFRLSLQRILDILNDYLYGCCTNVLTINYLGGLSPTTVLMEVYDIVSGDLIYTTTALGGFIQTISLPSKYFGPAALVKVCLTNITPPPGITTNKLSDTSGVLVSAVAVGQSCSSILKPLQSSYNIQQS